MRAKKRGFRGIYVDSLIHNVPKDLIDIGRITSSRNHSKNDRLLDYLERVSDLSRCIEIPSNDLGIDDLLLTRLMDFD